MQHYTITINGAPYPLQATRKATAKRYIIRVDGDAKIIKLTVPKYGSFKQGLAFAKTRENWILQQLIQHSQTIQLAPGVVFPLLGEQTLLLHESGRGTASLRGTAGDDASNQQLTIHGDIDYFSGRLERFLKKQLLEFIQPIARSYAEELGVTIKKISVRDTRSHWGSCAADTSLSFASRLAFAKPKIIDYVIAHEVAHIKEMNHSRAFWQLTEQLCPACQTHRAWLKKHGGELSRYLL